MIVLFCVIWIIFNGTVSIEVLLFGVVIAALLYTFCCKFLGYSIKKEIKLYKSIGMVIAYLCDLIIEIVKANLDVMKLILSERVEPEPVIVSFEAPLETSAGKSILADSITLTPGTITVTLEDNCFTVHSLDESMSEGIEDSKFVSRIKELEKIWRL